jgi:hypothetical protein
VEKADSCKVDASKCAQGGGGFSDDQTSTSTDACADTNKVCINVIFPQVSHCTGLLHLGDIGRVYGKSVLDANRMRESLRNLWLFT